MPVLPVVIPYAMARHSGIAGVKPDIERISDGSQMRCQP